MNEELDLDQAQVGRILHFVIDKGNYLKCSPAIVVEELPVVGSVLLQVFSRDEISYHIDSSPNHDVKVFHSWHWPRECAKLHTAAKPYVGLKQKYHHTHEQNVIDTNNCYACSVSIIHENSKSE